MTTTATTIFATETTRDKRHGSLWQMLHDCRRETQNQVHSRMRNVRDDRSTEVLDAGEYSEADVQEDIEFALIELNAATLGRIEEALGRLEAGEYGYCFTCKSEISEKRLRALPFAVRCKTCEETRERRHARSQQLAQHRSTLSLFSGVAAY